MSWGCLRMLSANWANRCRLGDVAQSYTQRRESALAVDICAVEGSDARLSRRNGRARGPGCSETPQGVGISSKSPRGIAAGSTNRVRRVGHLKVDLPGTLRKPLQSPRVCNLDNRRGDEVKSSSAPTAGADDRTLVRKALLKRESCLAFFRSCKASLTKQLRQPRASTPPRQPDFVRLPPCLISVNQCESVCISG